MGRWRPYARERLEGAALELFLAQGFTETTVPQITAHAGLTTRTFFRHFTDKREVLFADEDDIPAQVARLMADAPAELDPWTLVVGGFQAFAATRFEGRREHLRTRRAVIQANEGLRERELRKLAALPDAVCDGLRNRGVEELTATLTARIAVIFFNVSISRWLDSDGKQPLTELIHDTLGALHSVTAGLAVLAERESPSSPDGHRAIR